MINIYGTIGYTHLIHDNKKKDIIVYSDRHDSLQKCQDYITIGNYFKSKFKKSIILLEEVDRDENEDLKELWPLSDHTQELKNLYIKNNKIIEPIDIRPILINYSLSNEIINKVNANDKKITLYQYLTLIDDFFSLKNTYCNKKLNEFYTYDYLNKNMLGKHYLYIKKQYELFLNSYRELMYNQIDSFDIYTLNLLENSINKILDNAMEWYTCAIIYKYKKPIIIHTGLYHSEKILNLLKIYYNYSIKNEFGINSMNELDSNLGCIKLPKIIDEEF